MADCRETTDFNATMRKFGAPQTIIRSYRLWSILLRPAQATLGALVLAAHEPASAFSQLSAASFSELQQVTRDIEMAMTEAFHYDKINYLMLMMVDPDVHFHVLPRYAQTRPFAGLVFVDAGWPAVPNLGQVTATDAAINQQIIDHIKSYWP